VKLVSTKGNQSVVHAEALFGQIGVLCLELESQLKKERRNPHHKAKYTPIHFNTYSSIQTTSEVGEEFCNVIFGFLTLPLGHVIKLLGASSSISCIGNLYKSVEHRLSGCIKSDQYRNVLLFPKVATFFSSTHFLGADEVLPTALSIPLCSLCIKNSNPFSDDVIMKCSHDITEALAVNPKVPTMSTETGGGFAKGPCKFLVTDELGVVPFSLISSLSWEQSSLSQKRR
jgi:hypothetical protein